MDTLVMEFSFSLVNSYDVSNNVLGGKYSFTLKDKYRIEIRLPRTPIDDSHNMIMPTGFHYVKGKKIDWGRHCKSQPDVIGQNLVRSICVRVYASKTSMIDNHDEYYYLRKNTENLIDKILHNVRIINRDCVKYYSENNFSSGIFLRKTLVSKYKTDKLIEISAGLCKIYEERHNQLTNEQILESYNHLNDNISLPYSLYESTWSLLYEDEYRSCILACATNAEVIWKYIYKDYYFQNNIPEELKQHTLATTYGLASYKKLFKTLKIKFHECEVGGMTIKDLMDKRNTIIHAGLFPKPLDCYYAVLLIEKLLLAYNIPKFSDHKNP